MVAQFCEYTKISLNVYIKRVNWVNYMIHELYLTKAVMKKKKKNQCEELQGTTELSSLGFKKKIIFPSVLSRQITRGKDFQDTELLAENHFWTKNSHKFLLQALLAKDTAHFFEDLAKVREPYPYCEAPYVSQVCRSSSL